jgi:hypothetical protein
MPLPENCCSTLFTTGYKRLTEGGHEIFALENFWFGLLLWGFCFKLFALGFCFWLFAFGLLGFGAFGFWMKGGFLMWEALEGKGLLKDC